MASKPYASTGAYINRMSNYCGDCHYDVKEKTGETACPFNYLYWNFLEKNQRKLSTNRRLRLAYKNLEKVPKEKLVTVKKSAEKFLIKMGNGEKI
jgi:deoxyribodipyrimidine photolyase-related protein